MVHLSTPLLITVYRTPIVNSFITNNNFFTLERHRWCLLWLKTPRSTCVPSFSVFLTRTFLPVVLHAYLCVCCVCRGVSAVVDSWWMVTSRRCVATGTAATCVLIREQKRSRQTPGLSIQVESVVIITDGLCVCRRRGYKCWLLITLMTYMSRKAHVIINTSKSVSTRKSL